MLSKNRDGNSWIHSSGDFDFYTSWSLFKRDLNEQKRSNRPGIFLEKLKLRICGFVFVDCFMN